MEITTTKTVESSVLDGVSFTVRKLSYGVRLRITQANLEDLVIAENLKDATGAHDVALRNFAQERMQLRYVRECLVSVSGLTIDGKVPDAAAIIENCPAAFLSEIASAIAETFGLPEAEAKNSEPLSTSTIVQTGADGNAPAA